MSKRPVRVQLLLLGFVAIISLLAVSACAGSTKTGNTGADEPAPATTLDTRLDEDDTLVPPKEEKWHKVIELSGSGQADTGSFEITTDRYWRVTVFRPGAKAPYTASIYAVGETPETSAHHGQVTGSGDRPDSLNFTETGAFFVRMESGAEPWRILVEEIEFVYAE